MPPLHRQIRGHDALAPFLAGSDEDALVAFERPTLIRIPGLDPHGGARFVAALLHGNEDSGYRAVLAELRRRRRYPFELVVLIGNVRAARQEGWFAHRHLDDQEDMNRIWDLKQPTTRQRRCVDDILAELRTLPLDAGIDLHNNTGDNPPYAIVPSEDAASERLAALCSERVLRWHLDANTLMQGLARTCPAIAIECGLAGRPAGTAYAAAALRRFLTAPDPTAPADEPDAVVDMVARVTVRAEVPFSFGGPLREGVELVLRPDLDAANWGMLFAGTALGRTDPGAAMPLAAVDMQGREVTHRFFAIDGSGALTVCEDVTPVMMVRSVPQVRRDCLFYIARRRR